MLDTPVTVKAKERVRARVSQRTVSNILIYTFLVLFSVLILVPFLYMLTGAFKTNAEIFRAPIQLGVSNPTLDNFSRLFSGELIPYVRHYANSLLVAVGETWLTLAISATVGWGFAKYRFPGKTALLIVLIGTLALPFQIVVVPLYELIVQLGWLNTLWGVFIPASVSAFGAFLLRQTMLTIPNELLDAARIDGCTEWGIFWHVGIPMSRGALGVLAVLTFLESWNGYLWPSLVLRTPENFTLPIGLASLEGMFQIEYGMMLAGGLLATLPVIVLFLAGGKSLLDNVSAGAVKG